MNTLTEAAHLGASDRQAAALDGHEDFVARHIGTDATDQASMLKALGYSSRSALIDAVIPASIRARKRSRPARR